MTVRYPPKVGQAVPLAGPPGTELVIICGSLHAPPTLAALQTAWGAPAQLPLLPDLSVLRADLAGITVEQQGRDFGPPVDRPDAESLVRQRLAGLTQALRDQVEFVEAIAFAKRGG
jgi:hypothetical protein